MKLRISTLLRDSAGHALSDEGPPGTEDHPGLILLAVLTLLIAGGVGAGMYLVTQMNWRPPRHESRAIGSLKAIANAQTLFREGDKDCNEVLDYAERLADLTNTGSTGTEDLIDEVLAAGTKSGYVFRVYRLDPEFVWVATASPAEPGVTGNRYFGINMSGQLFDSLTGPVRFYPDGSSPDHELGQ